MRIDFSNIDDVKWAFSNNRTIALLRKENAPLILAFFAHAFKERGRITYLSSEVTSTLSDFLFAANQHVEQYPGTPKYYLDQWTGDGLLRQYYEARNDEAVFELTPASEKNLNEEEKQLFEFLKEGNVRLEQEKLRHDYVVAALGRAFEKG